MCTTRPHQRLTDLSAGELTDLFGTVQRVQHMLARHYFRSSSSSSDAVGDSEPQGPEAGSFNIAVQDGSGAGQTVPHVHVHVIPRISGSTAVEGPIDAVYQGMAGEKGNEGGALWDREVAALLEERGLGPARPRPGGGFPSIEDADRGARSMEEMEKEAEVFRRVLREMEGGGGS